MTYLDDPSYLPLLRGVLLAPDDDAPRLVLADWLLEHADPVANHRGRVLVGQLAGRSLYRKDAAVLLGDLGRHFDTWRLVCNLTEMASRGPVGIRTPTFHLRRGFIFRADLTDAAAWDIHAAAVFGSHPVTETRLAYFPRMARSTASGEEFALWTSQGGQRGWLPADLLLDVAQEPEINYRAKGRCGVLVPAAHGRDQLRWSREEAEDAARTALDRALIGWGRTRAGL